MTNRLKTEKACTTVIDRSNVFFLIVSALSIERIKNNLIQRYLNAFILHLLFDGSFWKCLGDLRNHTLFSLMCPLRNSRLSHVDLMLVFVCFALFGIHC